MGVIILLFLFGIWVLIDPKVEELLKTRSAKLIKIEQILGIELNDTWNKKRYKHVKLFRWVILLIIVLPNTLLLTLLTLFICVFIYELPVLNLKRKARLKIISIRYQFPIYLRQIQVLLQNNTVVKSIELSLDYVPTVLYQDIKNLHEKIKVDPLNMNHYINCMKQYDLPEIQRSMKWLYG